MTTTRQALTALLAAMSLVPGASAVPRGQGPVDREVLQPRPPVLTPPGEGETYTDEVFGTVVKRVTAGSDLGYATEYSESSGFSLNSKWLVIAHHGSGGYALATGDGELVEELWLSDPTGRGGPRWSRVDEDVLYYHSYDEIRSLNVETGDDERVRRFPDCGQLSFSNGEGDIAISPDGSRMITTVICPDDDTVRAYDFLSDTVYPAIPTGGVDAVAPVPDADGYYFRVGPAMWLHDLEGNRVRAIASGASHGDVGRDGQGRQIIVSHNGPWHDRPAGSVASDLIVGDIATGEEYVGVTIEGPPNWDLDVHVSGRAENGDFYVSTFVPDRFGGLPPPEEWGERWEPLMGEIFRLTIGDVTDPGTYRVERLLHHRSTTRTGYWPQPKVTASLDGTRIAWSSDFRDAFPDRPDQYADVYMTVLEQRTGRETAGPTARQGAALRPAPGVAGWVLPSSGPRRIASTAAARRSVDPGRHPHPARALAGGEPRD